MNNIINNKIIEIPDLPKIVMILSFGIRLIFNNLLELELD